MTRVPAKFGFFGITALCLGLWGLLCWIFFEGLQGSDDLSHLRFAWFWDRQPANHWELRLTFNALLRGALTTFGMSEPSAALPSLLGGFLTIGSILCVVRHRHGAGFATLASGLIAASLPGIVYSTTPSARPLAVGLLSVGFAIALIRPKGRPLAVAGLFMGVAVATHLSLLFAGAFAGLALLLGRHVSIKGGVLLAIATIVGFVLADSIPYAVWTGDPLYRFRVISASHLKGLETDPNAREAFDQTGSLRLRFLLRPITDVLLSRPFAATMGVALLAAFAVLFRRRSGTQNVTLGLTLVFGWLWMSYGTHDPGRYEPFPGTTPYWGGLILPAIVLLAEGLAVLPRRVGRLALVALLTLHLMSLGLSGSWGQSVEVSSELLDYTKSHPDEAVVADDRTLQEMLALNGYVVPGNLYRVPTDEKPSTEWARPLPAEHQRDARMLWNELNLRRASSARERAVEQWMQVRRDEEVHRTDTRYRTFTYVLPPSYRKANDWTLKRPGARVFTQAP